MIELPRLISDVGNSSVQWPRMLGMKIVSKSHCEKYYDSKNSSYEQLNGCCRTTFGMHIIAVGSIMPFQL
ncbi:MAG TPA: hypothetical protein DCM28_02570 [Phycisphaerales bacterium]|nr:hypothetical protein [Phycisphaerales bacterium]HCD35407.1 hypothetical protein [Phycisphaerales bacterium]